MKSDTFTVKISGVLDYKSARDFRQVIEEFNHQNAINITFDFGELSYIDSTGLGAIVKAFDVTKKNGGKLTIENASGEVLQSLKMSNFQEIADLA